MKIMPELNTLKLTTWSTNTQDSPWSCFQLCSLGPPMLHTEKKSESSSYAHASSPHVHTRTHTHAFEELALYIWGFNSVFLNRMDVRTCTQIWMALRRTTAEPMKQGRYWKQILSKYDQVCRELKFARTCQKVVLKQSRVMKSVHQTIFCLICQNTKMFHFIFL